MRFMETRGHSRTTSTPKKFVIPKSDLNHAYLTKPIVIYSAVPFGDDQIAYEAATSHKHRAVFRSLLILMLGGIIGYITTWCFLEVLVNNRSYSSSPRYFEYSSSARYHHLPMHLNPSHHIHPKHNYLNSLPSKMHSHHKNGLPETEKVTFKSHTKDRVDDDGFYEVYSKSDDVFDDYYPEQNIQEQ